jgi:hypothetical protein
MSLALQPVTYREAARFVAVHHRHNKPPRGHKFSIGVAAGAGIVGVVMVGRPVARALDNGLTAEVNRSCTDGTANANSMLYGAAVRAAKAMGYRRIITYTQADESGASLRAAGFRKVKELPARGSWAESSVQQRQLREVGLFGDIDGAGDVARVLWEVTFG